MRKGNKVIPINRFVTVVMLAICCFVTISTFAQQQETVYLSLEKLLEIGGANNLIIEQFQRQQDLAQADLAKAREWWLPEIYAGFQGHKLWGAAMNADGGFFLDVDRGNFWTGLGLDARWDFGEGIYGAKAATLRAEASYYRTQEEKNQVLLETIVAYYDFISAQLYHEAYREMAAQADTIATQLQIQSDAGIRFQSEVLLAKSNLNHLQVQRLEARKDYLFASARLANLLNISSDTRLVSTDSMLVPLELVPEAEWRQSQHDSAFLNRPEYRYLQTDLQAIQTERKSTTTGLWLPELRLGTYSSYFGGLFEQVKPMRPEENPELQTFYPTSAINASLMWRIPLGRLTYGGWLKQYNARIALRENEVRQFENQVKEEVSQAQSQLLMASEQLELAREAQTLAREAVQQSIQRQQLGTAKPFEVFQAQEYYLKARLDFLKALANYNKGQYSLYVALGNNL